MVSYPLGPIAGKSFDEAESDDELVNGTRRISYNERMNNLLIENMKKYTDMTDEEVDEFAYYLVAMDYFKLPDHRGGAVMPGTKHY